MEKPTCKGRRNMQFCANERSRLLPIFFYRVHAELLSIVDWSDSIEDWFVRGAYDISSQVRNHEYIGRIAYADIHYFNGIREKNNAAVPEPDPGRSLYGRCWVSAYGSKHLLLLRDGYAVRQRRGYRSLLAAGDGTIHSPQGGCTCAALTARGINRGGDSEQDDGRSI